MEKGTGLNYNVRMPEDHFKSLGKTSLIANGKKTEKREKKENREIGS